LYQDGVGCRIRARVNDDCGEARLPRTGRRAPRRGPSTASRAAIERWSGPC
jgi:hypothetical protein